MHAAGFTVIEMHMVVPNKVNYPATCKQGNESALAVSKKIKLMQHLCHATAQLVLFLMI
jgi:hypothetical protein